MRIPSVLLLAMALVLSSGLTLAQEKPSETAEKADKAKAKADKAAEKAAKKAAKAGDTAAKGAQETATEAAAAMPSHEEMMQAWEKAAKPGPEHEELAKAAGTWSLTLKHMMGPGEPEVSEGTAERSMILDGRVLVENVDAEAMGMPFKGVGHTGYDNVTGKYWSTWTDNMSTGLMHMTAEKSDGDKMTWTGKSADPMSGKELDMKIVTTQVSEDEELMEFYMSGPDGNMMKTMEITYKRQ